MNTKTKSAFALTLALALGTLSAGMSANRALAAGDPSVNWTGNGLTDGVGTSTCGTISSDLLAPVPVGQKGWLFVLSQIDGNPADWRLDVNFGPGTADDQTGLIPVQTTKNVAKWAVYSASGDTLDAAVAYAIGSGGTSSGNLVVSHCFSEAKLNSSTTTIIHDADHNSVTTVALGSVVHDRATVTGSGPTPTGAVSFTFFHSIDCTGNGTDAGTVNLLAGVADPSTDQGPLAAGSYSFQATYSGDANYDGSIGDCEPLTVNKAQLTIVTQIHNASHDSVGDAIHVPLGSVVHDTASVGGAVAGFDIPAVSFTLNGNPVANADPTDTGYTASTVDSAPLAAGSYTYNASVAGNDNYIGAISADEPLTVDKAQLTIVTQIHNASHTDVTNQVVAPGSVVHDTASVGGAVAGFDIPAVSFTLNGNPVANANPAETGYTASTVNSAPLAAGSYIYKAMVDSNSNYIGATAADEPLAVPQLGLTAGFWGNTNGQARINANGGYAANAIAIGRGSNIDSQAESLKVLPSTQNACGKGTLQIFTIGGSTATTNCTLATGININTLNNAAAQTLALGYNIKLVSGYSGQTINGLVCGGFVAGTGLTGSDTVNTAFNRAVALINGSAAGGTTTQAQLGAINSLLGSCLNREVF